MQRPLQGDHSILHEQVLGSFQWPVGSIKQRSCTVPVSSSERDFCQREIDQGAKVLVADQLRDLLAVNAAQQRFRVIEAPHLDETVREGRLNRIFHRATTRHILPQRGQRRADIGGACRKLSRAALRYACISAARDRREG